MANNEQDRLLDHSYDGIQEYDNPMPRWWVWIFYATIFFSVAYAWDPTGHLRGPGRVPEYEKQIADAATRWPAAVVTLDTAALGAKVGNAAVLAAGKEVFATMCAACHAADGGGSIGPNLTDDYWLHGSTIADVQRTIADGVLEKGMPAWARVLRPEQFEAVTIYVMSLRGTTPAAPKAPQGTMVNEQHTHMH